jgi:undecaprenyl-diphosphatase
MWRDYARQIVLATLQALTEIFPVSSSLHLLVFGTILGTDLSLERLAFFHVGTLLAVAFHYRKDLLDVVVGSDNWHTLGRLSLSTVVTGIVGISLQETILDSLLSNEQILLWFWILNGVMIVIAGRHSSGGTRQIHSLSWIDAVIIGAVQGIAVIPGISRLGITLTAALFRHMHWSDALRYTLLLSIPTIAAANIYLPLKEGKLNNMLVYGVSMVRQVDVVIVTMTFCITLAAVYVLDRYSPLRRSLLQFFGVYCISAGLFFTFFLRLY